MPSSRRRRCGVRVVRLKVNPFRHNIIVTTASFLLVLILQSYRVNSLMSNSVDDWVSSSAIRCNGIPGLTKDQKDLCHRNPDVTVAAVKGIEMAISECQHQFMWHRWNCTSLTPSSITQHSSVLLQRGYRETGFVYAIAAAGVAHSVSRACSMGRLISCGCDPSSYTGRTTKTGSGTQWKWGGCSHNLEFGMEFSRQFLDSGEVHGDIQSTVNLHNNHAGRMAVAHNMQVRCKCHGMSGSCELKTCWKVVPDFRVIGRTLKNRFRNAVVVTQSNFGNVTPVGRGSRGFRRRNNRADRAGNSANSAIMVVSSRQQRKHRNAALLPGGDFNNNKYGSLTIGGNKNRKRQSGNLVGQLFYFQKSPNFCERDPQSDIVGTTGRKCNRSSAGGDGCGSMCCGRGYNVIRQRRVDRCACKFHWCCYVQCQNCTVEEWITVCK